jgi:hypothetical protein
MILPLLIFIKVRKMLSRVSARAFRLDIGQASLRHPLPVHFSSAYTK